MTSIKNKFHLKYFINFSIFALIAAYFIQYVLGHKPCNLCLIERIPYFAAIFLISLIFILNKYEKININNNYNFFYFWCNRFFLSFWN